MLAVSFLKFEFNIEGNRRDVVMPDIADDIGRFSSP